LVGDMPLFTAVSLLHAFPDQWRAAGATTFRSGVGHAVAGALGDQTPLELRDGTKT